MTGEQILQKLVAFLESKDISVKSDRGNFQGGLVRYHTEKYLYFNRRLDTEGRIKLVLKEIKEQNFDLSEIDDTLSIELQKYAE